MSRRICSSLIAFIIVVPFALGLGSGTAAAAGDGLAYRSTTTYTLDAAAGVVHVLAEVSLTNTIPDKREGNYINRRYFTGFSLPVPVGATNQVATTSSGRALDMGLTFIDGNTDFFLFDIDLASNLFYQQSATVLVRYDITGQPPRSENPSRANGAYASFDAFGIGDEGKVTVRVVVPPGFEVDTFGDEATVTQEFGNTVYTAANIDSPEEFNIFVSARNDSGLVETAVETAEGNEFTVRSWPGDTEWQAFVTTQIEDGIPLLSEMIGQEWPIDENVEVREAYTPYLYGYAGWFSASRNEIEIGEDLDQEVVLHELSHAWFNDSWFVDRWLSEGFAQVYSNKAVDELGGDPLAPLPVRSNDAGKVSLNEWGDPNFTDGADESEDYGYNASFFVVQEIVDEVGDEAMLAVFDAVANSTIPYVGEVEPEDIGGVADWRRFLDLVEEIGGATDADELIDKYVVSNAQRELLEERATSRAAYADLVDHGGDWAPPRLVRSAMAAWSFGRADTKIAEAQAVLDLRDDLDGKATELASTYPDTFETTYEAAIATDDLDPVAAAVQEQIDTADAVLAAVAADAQNDGVFDKIGLIGTNLPALLEEAKVAFADGDDTLARANAQEVIDTVTKAPDVGKGRALWTGGAILLFLLLVILLVVALRRRRRRRQAAAADAAAQAALSSDGDTLTDYAPTGDDGNDREPEPGDEPNPTAELTAPADPVVDLPSPDDTGDSGGDSGGD